MVNHSHIKKSLQFIFLLGLIFSINFQTKAQVNDILKQAKIRAPELNGGKGWLNTDKPLSIAGLKGKIVLLDFWTYGCINCIHIIPDTQKLEAKYKDELVVIGVHSAKFTNESDTANIRNIILRYKLEHPVVNDSDFKIWDAYAVRAYPTRILIDAGGYIVGQYVGEGYAEEIDADVATAIADAKKKGILNEQPQRFALERAQVGDLPLAFPGKVLADEKSNRLFIADSNHNRIVVTDLSGKLLETIGAGVSGKTDGDFAAATFNQPQGMALDGEFLYIADRENHLIRRVDLKNKRVETVAGTGNLDDFTGEGGDAPLKVGLRSPWDLTLVGKMLYIAMAGSHQIWRMDLAKNAIEPYAGTRAEARYDDKIKDAAFAQPSGIVSDGKNLYVADSESNIIRRIDLARRRQSKRSAAAIYTSSATATARRRTRFCSIRSASPSITEKFCSPTHTITKSNRSTSKRKLSPPFSALAKRDKPTARRRHFTSRAEFPLAGDKLYIADTNNQAIRVADLTKNTVSTLKIEGLKPPPSDESETKSVPLSGGTKLAVQEIAAGAENSIVFNLKLPAGYHLNQNAPQRYEISVAEGNLTIANPKQKISALPLVVSFKSGKAGTATLRAALNVYYCREDNTGVCLIKRLNWEIPVKIVESKNASRKIEISETLAAE